MHLTTSIPTTDISLLRSHIAAISGRTIPILQQFTREFGATRPHARNAFPLSNKREQYDAAEIVAHVAKHIGDTESMRGWLKSTGTHLSTRGFTQNDCPAAAATLLAAIRAHSGPAWSTELELAFRCTFEQVFDMMSEGMPAASVPATFRMAA